MGHASLHLSPRQRPHPLPSCLGQIWCLVGTCYVSGTLNKGIQDACCYRYMGIRIWGSDKRSLFSSEEEQGRHVMAATTGALQVVTGDGSSASRQPDQGGPAVSVKEATAWGSSPPPHPVRDRCHRRPSCGFSARGKQPSACPARGPRGNCLFSVSSFQPTTMSDDTTVQFHFPTENRHACLAAGTLTLFLN